MSALQLPSCPSSLKSIQHYLKTASEHETRDPVIAYWCRIYALQTALKIDKKSDEAKALLMLLIEWLERQKKILAENEAISNDIAAQAHVENYALKLFIWADGQDRMGVFNKNVVKAFYTSGMLMDVLTSFGEPSEEIINNCKYAKWKAAYIHNCLKNGETPTPGPVGWDEEQDENFGEVGEFTSGQSNTSNYGFNIPPSADSKSHQFKDDEKPDLQNSFKSENIFHPSDHLQPHPSSPEKVPPGLSSTASELMIAGSETSIKLEPAQITKAQKYCKFAASALNYDDVPEAINNLQKALKLLQTGFEC